MGAENSSATGEVGKNWMQILAILIITTGGITEGFFFAWTSPFYTEVVTNKEVYDVNEQQANLFNSFYPLGMIIGSPLASKLSDKIGRKKTYLLTVIPQILSWLFAAFAQNVYYFYICRLLSGVSMGFFFAVLPNYVGEIANPSVRGTWGNAVGSSVYVGELLINVIGIPFRLKEASFFCLIFPVLFLILFAMMPESPTYLIMKGKEEEAKKSIRIFTRKQNVDKDYLVLQSAIKRQISESGSWVDLFKIKSNRKAIIAGTFLRISQFSSGLGVFIQYTQVILFKTGIYINPQYSGIIFMSLHLVLNLLFLFFVVDRFKRKTIYVVSLTGCGITMFILGFLFYFNVDLTNYTWLTIVLLLSYIIFENIGISCLPTLMLSELYSAKIKAKAMVFLMYVFSGILLIINTLYYYIEVYFGFHGPFLFFGICNTLSVVLSFYLIPETKGKTLEEIQLMLKGIKSVTNKNDKV